MSDRVCKAISGLLVSSSSLHLGEDLVSGIWRVLWYNVPSFQEIEACREDSHCMGLVLVSNKVGGETPFVGNLVVLKGLSDCCEQSVIFHSRFGEVSIEIDEGKRFH